MDKKQTCNMILGERNLIPHEIKEICYSCTRVGGAYNLWYKLTSATTL